MPTRSAKRREPPRTIAWLRRDTTDVRRRTWTPRRISLLRIVAAEPWLTFAELGERLGVTTHAAWQLAQRCVRDGLLLEHRPTTNGRPSRRAVYRITEDARRVVERKESR